MNTSNAGKRLWLALLVTIACVLASATALAQPRKVMGTLLYADREAWGTTLGNRPVRNVTVSLTVSGSPTWTATTNSNGEYEIWIDSAQLPIGANLNMTFSSVTPAANVLKKVGASFQPRIWSAAAMIHAYPTMAIYLSKTVVENDDAVLLNIMDLVRRSRSDFDIFRSDNDVIPQVKVHYPDPDTSVRISSCYEAAGNPPCGTPGGVGTMHISTPNGWQDGTIAHEFAHHLQYTISRVDTVMGMLGDPCHLQTSWEHAWHEGFPQYFAATIVNLPSWGKWVPNPINPSDFGFDMEVANPGGVGTCPLPRYPNSQESTWAALWDSFDGSGESNQDPLSTGWIAYSILDNEIEHASYPSGSTATIKKFHDAFVARYPYYGAHAHLDRVLSKYGILPGNGLHALSDYTIWGVIPSTWEPAPGQQMSLQLQLANPTGFTYDIPHITVRVSEGATTLSSTTIAPFSNTTTHTVYFTVPYSEGPHTLTVTIDSSDSTPEENENNNTTQLTVTAVSTCGDGYCGMDEFCDECIDDCGWCESPEPTTGACFVAGTQITMADGSLKPIEDIQVGDRVLSFDETTKQLTTGEVTELFVHPDSDRLVVVNETLVTTAVHPFYVQGRWVQAGDLAPGDVLLRAEGDGLRGIGQPFAQTVHQLEGRPGSATTYNFEVTPHHDYFAGGVLVHNIKPTGGGW